MTAADPARTTETRDFEFKALLARIENTPACEEALVERIARAMHEAVCDCDQGATRIDRLMAAAGLDVMRTEVR